MWRRPTVVVVALVTIAIVVAASNWSRLGRLFEDVVMDSREAQVPCNQRPSGAETKRVLAEHQDVIRRLRAVEGGDVSVEVDELVCPGRGTIVIFYNRRRDREQIERLIDADTFFGVPYSLRDV